MPDPGNSSINWEAFYGNFKKPGYIAGFEILEKLGAGVFGLVYKARKESIGKLYAIKFLKVDDESVREAVVRELESVRYFAQVDHPNLVAIEDKGEVDGIPYIVMAYAGASTLRKLLDAGPLGRDESLRIFVQIARGLQALHDRSLVHFDLKPANIYLKGDVARIGDYGLSKLVSRTHNSLSFGRGTPHYMAPEMLSRHGDHRSDIYSLGIVLYEMLVGRPPFKGDSEWEVLRKHEKEQPSYPADLDPGDRRLIEGCLAKDPEQRFQSVAEIRAQLAGIAQASPGEPGESRPARDAGSPLRDAGSPLRDAGPGGEPHHGKVPFQRRRPQHSGHDWTASIFMGVGLACAIFSHSFLALLFVSLGFLNLLTKQRSSYGKKPSQRQHHRSRHPALHRSAAMGVGGCLVPAALAIMVILLLYGTSHSSPQPVRSGTASVYAVQTALPRFSSPTPPPRPPQLLPFPKSTGYQRQKELQRQVRELRSQSGRLSRKIHTAMHQVSEYESIPALVNQMAKLNLRKVADANFGYRINELLRDLTRIDIDFQRPRNRRRVDARAAEHNAHSIQLWAKYYRSLYPERPSSRPSRVRDR